jgi:hypothetical protein
VGTAKRTTTELPGTAAKLVVAILQPGITITEALIEVRLEATLIGEPPSVRSSSGTCGGIEYN